MPTGERLCISVGVGAATLTSGRKMVNIDQTTVSIALTLKWTANPNRFLSLRFSQVRGAFFQAAAAFQLRR